MSRLPLDVEIHQQLIHRRRIQHGFLVARCLIGIGRCQFQTIQRALARPGFAPVLLPPPLLAFHIRLAAQQCQQWVRAQLVMIVEVLVAQRQSVDSLPHQFPHAVFGPVRISMVSKAAGKLPQNTRLLFHFVQQQPARLGGDHATVEPGHYFLARPGGKLKAGLGTLCHRESRLSCSWNIFFQRCLCHGGQLSCYPLVRNPH